MRVAHYYGPNETQQEADAVAREVASFWRLYAPEFRIQAFPLPPEFHGRTWGVSSPTRQLIEANFNELWAWHNANMSWAATNLSVHDGQLSGNNGIGHCPGPYSTTRRGASPSVAGVVIHELGHNGPGGTGLQHAAWGDDKYGDFTSFLAATGSHETRRKGLNAPQMATLDLVTETDATESMQYLLRPLELPQAACFPNEIQCIRIGKWWISLRSTRGHPLQALHESHRGKVWVHEIEESVTSRGPKIRTILQHVLTPGQSRKLTATRTLVYEDFVNQSARLSVVVDGKIPDDVERQEGLP